MPESKRRNGNNNARSNRTTTGRGENNKQPTTNKNHTLHGTKNTDMAIPTKKMDGRK